MKLEVNWNLPIKIEHEIHKIQYQQEKDGWQFDVDKAVEFCTYLETKRKDIYDSIRPHLCKVVQVKYKLPISKPFKKTGGYTKSVTDWYEDVDEDYIGGPFSRVEFVEPNLDSDQQLKDQLLRIGWKPTQWNFKKEGKRVVYGPDNKPIKTSPKITEDSFDSLSEGIGPSIKTFLIYGHRLSQITGFLRNVRPDGTIQAKANPCGTPTARYTHSVVVNVPKADPKVVFGKEVRSLFIARPGRVLVGGDASGLEARVGSHWTYKLDGGQYANDVLNGDWHSKNVKQVYYVEETKDLDTHSPTFGSYRSRGKNGSYALMYGAQPPKLAETLGIPVSKAKKIWDLFWEINIGLGKLKARLEWYYRNHGYIVAIDGRKIYVRKESDLINYLFQSTGAIIMKVAKIILVSWIKRYNLDAIIVGDFHDEFQLDCHPDDAHKVGALIVRAIRNAGEFFELAVPLDGEYKIGKNWAETH